MCKQSSKYKGDKERERERRMNKAVDWHFRHKDAGQDAGQDAGFEIGSAYGEKEYVG